MWVLDLRCLLIFVWIVLGAKPAECIICVQCSSLFQSECINGQLAPTDCPENSTYCIRYKGTTTTTGDKFVTRDCAESIEKPGCRYMVIYEKDVRVCYTFCQTDGCNSNRSNNTNKRISDTSSTNSSSNSINTAPAFISLHWTLYTISAFSLNCFTKVIGL